MLERHAFLLTIPDCEWGSGGLGGSRAQAGVEAPNRAADLRSK